MDPNQLPNTKVAKTITENPKKQFSKAAGDSGKHTHYKR